MRLISHHTFLFLLLLVCGTVVAHGENERIAVEVDAEHQDRYGIVTEALKEAEYHPGRNVFGEVIDHFPLLQQWNACRVAELAEESARKEYDRLVKLNTAGKFSSDHAVELAGSTLEAASLEAKLATTTLAATWGLVPGSNHPKIDNEFLKSLINRQSALVRVSVPPTQLLPLDSAKIWLTPPGDLSQKNVLKGSWMDPKVSSQKSPGFLGIVALEGRLWPVGLGLVGRIETSDEPLSGFLIPASAVIYQHGAAWAYLKSSGELFQQVQIDLSKPQDSGWFVSGKGMDPKFPLVIQGAQGLLAQQLQETGDIAGDED